VGLSGSVAMSELGGAVAGSGRGDRRSQAHGGRDGTQWMGEWSHEEEEEGHQRSIVTSCGDGSEPESHAGAPREQMWQICMYFLSHVPNV
jgi:hypothetical protein